VSKNTEMWHEVCPKNNGGSFLKCWGF
jgi:hypothetical protein